MAASPTAPSGAALAHGAPSADVSQTSSDQGVLRGASEAIATSLVDGTVLEVGRSMRLLRDALLAENSDAGEAAATRCSELRNALADTVRDSLRKRKLSASIVEGDGPAPRVRVEVRGTAGRMVMTEAFAVGRAPECDVQTSSDGTVSRLQFLAISVPGGIVVVDAWSSGGTRVVRRSGPAGSLPASVASRRQVFIVPHGERVCFLIGAKTTVTFGPVDADLAPSTICELRSESGQLLCQVVGQQYNLCIRDLKSLVEREAHIPTGNLELVDNGRVLNDPSFQPLMNRQQFPAALTVVQRANDVPATVPNSPTTIPATVPATIPATVPRTVSTTMPATIPASGTMVAVTAASAAAASSAISAPTAEAVEAEAIADAADRAEAEAIAAAAEAQGSSPSVPGLQTTASGCLTNGVHQEEEDRPAQLGPGALVRLTRLVQAADLNGTAGIVVRFDANICRWVVRLETGRCKNVRPENLELRAANPCPGAPPAGRNPAFARAANVVLAGVRLQQLAAARERLRWRCRSARKTGVVTEEQCCKLEESLRSKVDDAAAEVADILDGLGVSPAVDDPSGGTSWECSVCRSAQRSRGWRCPFGHRFCRDCMVQWIGSQATPRCPQEGCGYLLGEHDLEDIRVSAQRLEAFRTSQIEHGLARLESAESQQSTVFRCAFPRCGAAVVAGRGERRRYACSCGAPPVCTGCSAPYHYHGKCADVQPLRARWIAWLQGGREAYKGLQKRTAREATAQQRVLREAMARHTELERDESWKALNCRCCPRCRRPVVKVDGCNTMVCGENTHGGNRQPGCGHRFSWLSARPYRPAVGAARPSGGSTLARAGAVGGRGVRHLFTQCRFCEKCIVGPRFRCLHCPSFDVCQKCEPRVSEEHEEGHVFEILFEDELDWHQEGVVLPRGIRARIRQRVALDTGEAANGSAAAVASRKRKRDDAGLEGVIRGQKRNKYVLELSGGAGTRQVAAEDIQPLLTPKQAERILQSAPAGAFGGQEG